MNKKRFYFPISVKMIIMVSLIIMISLSGLTYFATYFFQRDSVVRIQEMTAEKSKVIGMKVRSDMERIISIAMVAADIMRDDIILNEKKLSGRHRPDISRRPDTAAAFIREGILDRESEIIYIAVLTRHNKKIVPLAEIRNESFLRTLGDFDYGFTSIINDESPYFENAFNGITGIHNSSPRFNHPVLGMSIPLPGREYGSMDKVIVVYFSMDIFQEAVLTYTEYETFVVNGEGELIAHPDPGLLINNISFLNHDMVREMLKSPLDNGQHSYTDPDGIPRMGSFSRAGLADSGVITTVDRNVALEAVHNLQKRNVYITIIVLLSAMIVVYIFAKTLTGPILRLVEAARQIKEGNYRPDLTSETSDEIGSLTESFIEMSRGLEEREKMKEAFGKFVNPEITELAMKGELTLGGERKTAAVFFLDIRNFTDMSEQLEPEEVVDFLNEYMTLMVDCVNKTKGVVDKFIGDALMAVWGTPVSHGNDTENAINAALMMRKALADFNSKRGDPRKPIIKAGCGINTGPVLAGQIGSEDRMEYTVIGDTVNLAARLESLNKSFGTDIIISEDSYRHVKGIFTVVRMKKINVKGKSEPQQIYAVVGRRDDPDSPKNMAEFRRLLGLPVPGNSDNPPVDRRVKK